jgi:hypothetical protein
VQHVGAISLFHEIKQIAKPLEDRPLEGGRKRNQRCVAQLGTEVRQDSRNAVERAGHVGMAQEIKRRELGRRNLCGRQTR